MLNCNVGIIVLNLIPSISVDVLLTEDKYVLLGNQVKSH